MSDEHDSGLTINLSTFSKRKKVENTELKTIRPDAKHSKVRLPAKKSKDDHEPETGGSSTPSVNIKHRKEGTKDRETSGIPAHGIISSLFRTNPDIPVFEKQKVKQVKEKLFSSEDFHSLELHPYMVSNLEKLGFTKMTAVQRETVPKLMKGNDVLVKSQTGSGKTMAYAIPIIQDLAGIQPKIKRQDGILAVILVPTRELAIQSFDVFSKLVKPFIWVVPGCLMGGEQRKAEKARLRKGVNILIATPGRMIDHMQNTANMELENVRWLVLDEADRLLDMGFEAQVSRIVSSIERTRRQTVLLSATLTEGVERLAGVSLNNPLKVAISEDSEKTKSKKTTTSGSAELSTADTITEPNTTSESIALPESLKQYFVIIPCKLRLVCLLSQILAKCKKNQKTKMIVFLSTQDSVEFLYRLVQYLSVDHQSSDVEGEEIREPESSLNLFRLHGDMAQKERISTFQDFCTAKTGALLCTDVAARGLHLPAVDWVVQYTCPAGLKDYVHRAGRTARAGTAGTSLMFVLPSEVKFVEYLGSQKISLTERKISVLLSDALKLLPTLPAVEATSRELPRTAEEAATYLQYCCEEYIRKNKEMGILAKKAFRSSVRAYATYPTHLKFIFHLRHLHLGHMAKSCALRDAPSNITAGIPGLPKKRQKKEDKKRKFHWDEEVTERKDSKVMKLKPQKPAIDTSEYGGAPIFDIPAKMPKKGFKKGVRGKMGKRRR